MEIASTSSIINVEEIPLSMRQVYYKLRSIFPNIKSSYIKEIVIDPTRAGYDNNQTEEEITTILIDYLIEMAHVDLNNLSISQNFWESDIAYYYEEQANRLIGIFPDADPEFLDNFAKQHYKEPQKIHYFIEDNLNKKTYPSREEYVKRKKLEESFHKYFTNFDTKQFLKEIKEPFKYFEAENRICKNDKEVFDLLVKYFKNLQVNTILKEYQNCKFNPSLTAKRLHEIKNGVPTPFSNGSIKNVEHMQEFSFICHRKNIKDYMEKIKKEEEETLLKSREKNELLSCESCYNDFIQSKCSMCDNGHIFCNDCISSGTECKISDAIYTIKCFLDCDAFFSQKTLMGVLTPKMFNILLKKQQEAELASANIQNLQTCPFCNFKCETNEENKIFTCLNDDCKKESCRRCKKLNHLPNECEDVFEIKKSRLYIEEKLTKSVIRICYKCKKEFIKLEGCNRMACVCGGVMCYICDKPVPSNHYKHFNAQGADRHDLCPLYSDDHRQEAESIIEVARITKEEILKKNPDFNVEIFEKLLPKLPPKTAGPHDQIPNSNQLPEHALKVAKAFQS